MKSFEIPLLLLSGIEMSDVNVILCYLSGPNAFAVNVHFSCSVESYVNDLRHCVSAHKKSPK
jgi:hypothetical protein